MRGECEAGIAVLVKERPAQKIRTQVAPELSLVIFKVSSYFLFGFC